MNVLHCVETQGINGAQDTMNCALTHAAHASVQGLVIAAIIGMFLIVIILVELIIQTNQRR